MSMIFPSYEDVSNFHDRVVKLLYTTVVQMKDGAESIGQWVLNHPQLFTLVTLLAIVPAIFWLWLFIRKDAMDRRHKQFMILTFVVGMFTVLPVFFIDEAAAQLFGIHLQSVFSQVQNPHLGRFLYFVVCVGMMEEYSKHLAVKEVSYRRKFFNRIVDGIEFSIAAALGFAFIENILYFLQAWNMAGFTPWKFAGVVIIRSVGSMLAHVLFSGIFGYYYGRAKFLYDSPRSFKRKRLHTRLWSGILLRTERIKHAMEGHHILVKIGRSIHRDQVIAEGLVIAMTLHGLYNFFLDMNRVYLIVPLIFLEFLFIWHELEVTENRRVHVPAGG